MKTPRIKIHYSLFFLIVVALYTGSILTILFLLSIIVLHELGHMIFLLIFHAKFDYLEISIMGGMLNVNKDSLNTFQKIIVDLAGISVNILLIFVFFDNVLIRNYNILMIVFNLFPIIPLDGFQLFNDICLCFYEEEYTFYLSKIISTIMLIILLIVIILLKINGLFIIFGYLLYRLIMMSKNKYYLYKKVINFYNNC